MSLSLVTNTTKTFVTQIFTLLNHLMNVIKILNKIMNFILC